MTDIDGVKESKGVKVGIGLTITAVIATLVLMGYDITENTYYCSSLGEVYECKEIKDNVCLPSEIICKEGWVSLYNNSIPTLDGKFRIKEFEIEVRKEKDTSLNKDNVDWYLKDGSFYADLKSAVPLEEIHFIQNRLKINETCWDINQWITACRYIRVSYDKFRDKNNITLENLTYDNQTKRWVHSFYGEIINTDPELEIVYDADSTLVGWQTNQTNVSNHGISLTINTSAWGLYDGDRISPYMYSDGNFTSLVFYNSTSTYWNTTLSLADSNGSPEVYDLCLNDANCVSYWDLDSGNTDANPYNDEKGSNDGTPTGTNNATGISSGAMRFDGVDDYIEVNLFSVIDSVSELSICSWVYHDSISDDDAIINKYEGADNDGFYLWRDDTGGVSGRTDIYSFLVGDSGDGDTARVESVQDASQVDVWTHICGTFVSGDSSGLRLYINGIEDVNSPVNTTSIGAIDSGADFLRIGSTYTSLSIFNGSIDEVLIYNKSLTASEVEQLYKAGLSQHANTNITLQTRTADSYNLSDSGLIGLWGLNGDATDETGNNDGTGIGSTIFNESKGIVGQGIYFTDSGAIALGDIGVTDYPFTGSVWFKSTDNQAYIISLGDKDVANQFIGFYIDNGAECADGYYRYIHYDGVLSNYCGSEVNDDEWHYLSFVFTNNTYKEVYLDGVLDISTSDNQPIPSNVDNWKIGVSADSTPTGYINGSIDEVRIYNRSLSAAEIQNLYELGSYHIEWNDWDNEGKTEDSVPKTSTGQGKFFQYRANYETDDTDVSSYLLNHSITNASASDATPPTITWNWADINSSVPAGIDYTTVGVTTNEDANCTLHFNGTDYTNATTAQSITWTLTGLGVGNYSTVNVSCEDSSGNQGNTTDAWVYFSSADTTPPTIAWNWTDINTTSTTNSTTAKWDVSDLASSIDECNLTVNGTIYNNATGLYTQSQNLTNYADGNWTLQVQCNDSVGNVGTSTSAWWYVDATAPTITQIISTVGVDWMSVTCSATESRSTPITYNLTINGTGESTGFVSDCDYVFTSLDNDTEYQVTIQVNDSLDNQNIDTITNTTLKPAQKEWIPQGDMQMKGIFRILGLWKLQMYAPNGTAYWCGPENDGTWSCS